MDEHQLTLLYQDQILSDPSYCILRAVRDATALGMAPAVAGSAYARAIIHLGPKARRQNREARWAMFLHRAIPVTVVLLILGILCCL